jgi:hypothetical protein
MKRLKHIIHYDRLNEGLDRDESRNLLDTLDFIRPSLIASGEYNKVYQDAKSSDKIIKQGPDAIKHAMIFNKFPEYFPIVYRVNRDKNPLNSYIIIEKLDTVSAQRDIYNIMNKAINWNYHLWTNDNAFNELSNLLDTNEKAVFARMREIIKATKMKDIHAGNFGYDKKGILKALDI